MARLFPIRDWVSSPKYWASASPSIIRTIACPGLFSSGAASAERTFILGMEVLKSNRYRALGSCRAPHKKNLFSGSTDCSSDSSSVAALRWSGLILTYPLRVSRSIKGSIRPWKRGSFSALRSASRVSSTEAAGQNLTVPGTLNIGITCLMSIPAGGSTIMRLCAPSLRLTSCNDALSSPFRIISRVTSWSFFTIAGPSVIPWVLQSCLIFSLRQPTRGATLNGPEIGGTFCRALI